MYELLKTDGLAKRGRLHTVHGVIETPCIYECRNYCGNQGRGVNNRSAGDWDTG